MDGKRVRVIFFIIIFGLFAAIVYSVFSQSEKASKDQEYRFDFEQGEDLSDFWTISNFGTFDNNKDLVKIKDGVLTLFSSGDDMPMMVSKPIDVPPGSVITVTRKVRVTRDEHVFAGGMAMFQTDDTDLVVKPCEDDESWGSCLGDCMALIEYSYDLFHKEKRPGKDVFRFLAADWEINKNHEIIMPIYDEWFVETLSYDTRLNRLSYRINFDNYTLTTYSMDKPAVRLLMHSYGKGDDCKVEIDYIEITVEDQTYRRTH